MTKYFIVNDHFVLCHVEAVGSPPGGGDGGVPHGGSRSGHLDRLQHWFHIASLPH